MSIKVPIKIHLVDDCDPQRCDQRVRGGRWVVAIIGDVCRRLGGAPRIATLAKYWQHESILNIQTRPESGTSKVVAMMIFTSCNYPPALTG